MHIYTKILLWLLSSLETGNINNIIHRQGLIALMKE